MFGKESRGSSGWGWGTGEKTGGQEHRRLGSFGEHTEGLTHQFGCLLLNLFGKVLILQRSFENAVNFQAPIPYISPNVLPHCFDPTCVYTIMTLLFLDHSDVSRSGHDLSHPTSKAFSHRRI
jgi:hypothetical protein